MRGSGLAAIGILRLLRSALLLDADAGLVTESPPEAQMVFVERAPNDRAGAAVLADRAQIGDGRDSPGSDDR